MPDDPQFDGKLIWREEPDYEEARVGRVFNARKPGRLPAAVLMAASEADVVAGVRLAKERGLQVSVRAGGHSWAAWSVREEALLIDLGGLREIELDAETGIVKASPSTKGGAELSPFLAERGRMFTGGHCETVGLGGFLLQGGQGWNSRAWGWGCMNVVGIDVVTADGELVHADEEENSDLLWAARGGGPGFFGAITRFHLRTYPAPPAPTRDTWVFSLDDLEPLLEWVHGVLPTLEATCEPVIAATRLPDLPLYPGIARPEGPALILNTTAFCESTEEADEFLAAFAADACPLADRALGHERVLTDLADEFRQMTVQNPEDHRYAADCSWTNASAAELAPRLRDVWGTLPTEHSFSIWYGWAPRQSLPDMAFSVEGDVYLAAYAIWIDPNEDEAMREWTHAAGTRFAEVGHGVYLGDTDFTRRCDRFMTDENYARFLEIRSRRDPDGLFCSYLHDEELGLNAHS
ncbi:MAG: FAD-binding oxidoreductase [Actinobacteria bacterium]|nr:FAD-binding oxidoreductase [Actinomycetota bacterium]